MITEKKLYADGKVIAEMKIIKIIDLLLKISKDEDIPKRIKHNNIEYVYEDVGYYNEKRGYLFDEYYIDGILNDEIEIIDEPEEDKIEKLDQTLNRLDINNDYYRYIMENRFKINELIDEVNKLI